jgi:hypothetical protein
MKKIIILYVLVVLLIGCNESIETVNSDIVLRNNRLLGINYSDSTLGFETDFKHMREANGDLVEILINWPEIETAPYTYTDPRGLLKAIEFYGDEKVQVGITIGVINTVKYELPGDINYMMLGEEETIDRFVDMAKWVLKSVPENVEVAYLSIGNEIDLRLDSKGDWERYLKFYSQVYREIKSIHPDIVIGSKITVMEGLVNELTYINMLSEYSDVLMLNYYPQDEEFRVLDPTMIYEHFEIALTNFDLPIYITEIGYQSGDKYCNSSEDKQAEFYKELFKFWDLNYERIPVILIAWLNDQSDEIMSGFKEYYGDQPNLVEYLETLGVRNHDGTPKKAYDAIKHATNERKWAK